jgi:hypothetical protein
MDLPAGFGMRTDEFDDMEDSGDEVAMALLWKLPAYSTIA